MRAARPVAILPQAHRLATDAVRPRPIPVAPRALAITRTTTPGSADQRTAMMLLALPFLVVALSLGASKTNWPRFETRLPDLLAMVRRPAPPVVATPVPVRPDVVVTAPLAYPMAPPRIDVAALAVPSRPPVDVALPGVAPSYPQTAPSVPVPPPVDVALPGAAPAYPIAAPDIVVATAIPVPLPRQIALPGAAPSWPPALPALAPPVATAPALTPEQAARLAAWQPPTLPWQLDRAPPLVAPLPEALVGQAEGGVCTPSNDRLVSMNRRPVADVAYQTITPEEFGLRLAAAARAQTDDLVIYTARYQRIAPRLGDLPSLYGACSDLVVRAYRTLGVDLQGLVQAAGVGTGDTSIDHRRTATLRRLFTREGASLPITDFPENYKPGDIVTYYRPFSRVSRDHIAIVSDIIAPTGRPMIIHNRGYGPQIEDALFVDRITGHYRFVSPRPALLAAAAGPPQIARAAPPAAALAPVVLARSTPALPVSKPALGARVGGGSAPRAATVAPKASATPPQGKTAAVPAKTRLP